MTSFKIPILRFKISYSVWTFYSCIGHETGHRVGAILWLLFCVKIYSNKNQGRQLYSPFWKKAILLPIVFFEWERNTIVHFNSQIVVFFTEKILLKLCFMYLYKTHLIILSKFYSFVIDFILHSIIYQGFLSMLQC